MNREATRPQVVVIDAGVGNLGNVERALRSLGAEVAVTADPEVVAAGRCLVLPGVGAFRPPREVLRPALEPALHQALDAGAWLLGICVGYQLLFATGEEFGTTDGLGLLPGRVTELPADVPRPHIGWNRLLDLADHPLFCGLGGTLPDGEIVMGGMEKGRPETLRTARNCLSEASFEGRPQGALDDRHDPDIPAAGSYMYFVHSFAPEDVPAELCLARCLHGRAFPAVAGRGRVLGTQFHPEKSGPAGLRLLANFLELAHGTAAGP